jgi:anaerobic ribonucleoside-triphosphate reductase activating protein
MDTWAANTDRTTVDEVIRAVANWTSSADGITVSGGEPFDQPNALIELLRRFRETSDADILVYTGHPIEKLSDYVERARGLIDALITDPFERSKLQTLALRGSDNQRLHLLTDLGRQRFASYERPADSSDRAVDVMFDEDGSVWFAGIPARNDLRRLQQMLEATGATVTTSEDRRQGPSLVRPT